MSKEISITSSSFVLPKNPNWIALKKDLNFDYVNNLNSGFMRSNVDNSLISIIFISDFYDIGLDYNQKQINRIVNTIIYLVKNRIKQSNKPIIFGISKWCSENLIRTLVTEQLSEKIGTKLIQELKKIQKKNINLYILDLDKEFSYYGYNKSFDERNWYLANCRLSVTGLEIMINAFQKIIKRIETSPHKVLVLDCDNTLWGGVLGEDGISSIKLGDDGIGKAFLDFQKVIKKIGDQGVILTVSSKNNYNDVINVFNKHKSMYLKKKDIFLFKVNWEEKFQNIKEISQELGLSLDSFVFWDDNPLERDKIKTNLPQVRVIEPSKEVTGWPRALLELDEFAKIKTTKEDKNKKKQYKIKSIFEKKKTNSTNINKYLKSIKLKPKAIRIDKSTIERAHQIIMKTNQFNLRTERLEKGALEKFSKNTKNFCFLTGLKDIYGDHGIVGLVMTSFINKETIFLNNFIMSCRILGRHLESWMFKHLVNFCKKEGIKKIQAEYIKSNKNILVSNLLTDYGFKKINNRKNMYILNINNINLKNIEIYD